GSPSVQAHHRVVLYLGAECGREAIEERHHFWQITPPQTPRKVGLGSQNQSVPQRPGGHGPSCNFNPGLLDESLDCTDVASIGTVEPRPRQNPAEFGVGAVRGGCQQEQPSRNQNLTAETRR